ncbi:hypothetical protein PDESU_04247 [Pontiella desulfatans]|uniref:PEP-CTERM protein-sorting domain-containing protein n=1 Tax=Pontiella desulfatans TaxID=2750659 RepID=A0A6C2U6G2_PONDE|nr:PEP-CTERM sorting domain-containing protein [Pontiella desulfatans]VGO15662.1 hypothetical protein PDESU_04247 [Pontiella desulfatans]
MKKIIVAIMALSGLMASVHADPVELIVNGGFEEDGYTSNDVNNVARTITGWSSSLSDNKLRVDHISALPGGVDNTVIRMLPSNVMYQNLTTDWDADSTFTLSFNASEVSWKNGAVGNRFFPQIKTADNSKQLWLALADLDGNNDGSTYTEWQANQTFSWEITGQELLDTGFVSAGDALRLHINAASDSDSINWIDNVSMTVIPEPATLGLVVAMGGSLLWVRRVFMV